MPMKFKCKTGEAYQIKVLAELLTNNLKTGCFEVSRDGIVLRMFDHPRKTLVDLSLLGENFSLYKFKFEEKGVKVDIIDISKIILGDVYEYYRLCLLIDSPPLSNWKEIVHEQDNRLLEG